ncbi:hypothetical protein KQI68_06620 [Peptoniphilus sp. MSJ-1]|uniref:Phage protein n=1 Tax=Peptoniphilus ovalis TaxID=2841503 RepID=A0ABS6FJT0_9FIRM|nr:hypothetical protein [Peptoniphilus ovalis]MBU5669511.1 hypothetical protein [Peptoniphilus ovalis]
MQEYLDIDKRQHTFNIKTTVFGKEVEGEFTCKYPSVLDSVKIQVLASRYLEGADNENIFDRAVVQAFKLASLDVLLVKKPDWYDIDNLDRFETIDDIYREVDNFTATFRNEMYKSEDTRDSSKSGDSEVVEGE